VTRVAKKTWKISAAQVTAAAAIVTSVLALVVSVYETRIMRSWQQASTQPIIEIQLDFELLAKPIEIDLHLKNMGQGTAYVQGMKITFDGDTIETNTLGQYWPGRSAKGQKKWENRAYRGYLGPGDLKHPMSVTWTPPPAEEGKLGLEYVQTLNAQFKKTEISVCYCSVFERCWISDFKTQSRAKLVPVCPADYT